MSPIQNRYDFVYLFDVADGNPNGDLDAGNQPRIDPETGEGLVTDVRIKRKIRNAVQILTEGKEGCDIYVQERGILANQQKKAYLAISAEPSDGPNERARAWMCKNFYDIRAFGAVMTTGKVTKSDSVPKKGAKPKKEEEPPEPEAPESVKSVSKGKGKFWNCGQVRGPVQITFARSVGPILSLEHAITRVALTNADDTGSASTGEDDEKASSGQMGRKMTVPYALYVARGFVSAHLAADTGFDDDDLGLLWKALVQMFEFDRSASRGQMSARGLYVFKHASKLGNAASHALQDRVLAKRRDATKPVRAFEDFVVDVDRDKLPSGVELIEVNCNEFDAKPILVGNG
jgi:CRISPR-associated protein Csd2